MNDETKYYLFTLIGRIEVVLCVVFYMLAGTTYPLSTEPNETLIRIAWTSGLIAVPAFILSTVFWFRDNDFEKHAKAQLVYHVIYTVLSYAIPIGFIRSWYKGGLERISFLLILSGIVYFICKILVSLFYYLKLKRGVSYPKAFYERSRMTLRDRLSGFILTVACLLPLGFVVYFREIYFEGYQLSVPNIPFILIFWWAVYILTGGVVLISLVKLFVASYRATKKYLVKRRKSYLLEGRRVLNLKEHRVIDLNDRFNRSEEYDMENENPAANYSTLDLHHQYSKINIIVALVLICLSVAGILYLMVQNDAFAAKNSTVLIVTEVAWILIAIGPPLYHFVSAIRSKRSADN